MRLVYVYQAPIICRLTTLTKLNVVNCGSYSLLCRQGQTQSKHWAEGTRLPFLHSPSLRAVASYDPQRPVTTVDAPLPTHCLNSWILRYSSTRPLVHSPPEPSVFDWEQQAQLSILQPHPTLSLHQSSLRGCRRGCRPCSPHQPPAKCHNLRSPKSTSVSQSRT